MLINDSRDKGLKVCKSKTCVSATVYISLVKILNYVCLYT